jgi:hypothetical protein
MLLFIVTDKRLQFPQFEGSRPPEAMSFLVQTKYFHMHREQ